jgi:Tfp pilus assembly protein PilF
MLRASPCTVALLCLPVWAQVAAIQGTVEDEDHRPLGGVSVRIEGQDVYALRTDVDGTFVFRSLAAGAFRVLCEADPASVIEVQARSAETAVVKLTCTGFGIPQSDREILDRVSADLEGDAKRQLAEFEQTWQKGPFDWESLNKVIEAGGADRLKELRDRWRRAIEDTFDEGKAAAGAKDYRTAVARFHRVLVRYPGAAVAWAWVADCYAKLGWLAPAQDAYAKAVQLKPEDASLRNNYGLVLARSGKLEGALTQINEAVRLDPAGGGRYFYNLGAILVNSGHSLEAREAFRRAVDSDPNYADAHYQYAVSLAQSVGEDLRDKVREEMREELLAYLRLAPNGQHAKDARKMLQALRRLFLLDEPSA